MKLISILIILVVLTINVSAIGISPGKYTIDFKPNYQENVDFRIINNENKDMKVVLYTEGELANLVNLKDQTLEFKSTDGYLPTSHLVKFPEAIERPGTHEVRIIARELTGKSGSQGASVGVTLAVASRLYIRVPYPDKYAEITDLNIQNNGINKSVRFIIPVSNLGSKNILHTKAVIDIMGPTNEIITRVFSDDQPIESMQKRELVASWLANVNPGKFYAIVNVNYDDKFTKAEKEFEVGELFIDIVDVYVKDFRLGGVARFDILIKSNWNEPIKEVYAGMQVLSTKGDDITNVKSASTNIEAFGGAQLSTFWDTEGVEIGQYDTNLKVNYAGRVTQRLFKSIVTTNAIKIEGFPTGRVTGIDSGFDFNINTTMGILLILVVLLVIMNIVWFVYFKRRMKPDS